MSVYTDLSQSKTKVTCHFKFDDRSTVASHIEGIIQKQLDAFINHFSYTVIKIPEFSCVKFAKNRLDLHTQNGCIAWVPTL